jgi:hypothetical protein
MARITSQPSSLSILAIVLLAGAALAAEPAKEPPKETPVTVTFGTPGRERARLTVTPGETGTKAAAFRVVAGAVSQVFTRMASVNPRTIDVPADPKAFVRFSVEVPGAAATQALALITPDARPLLTADSCGAWDLATSGGSASAACQGLDRHCPVAAHPSADRSLTLHQCGNGPVKFCVPDYKIELTGEKGQKVRVGVEGSLGDWIILRSPKVRKLFIASGGACPGVIVESSSDRVRLSLGWGQRVLVRISPDGQIGAEDLPLEAQHSGGGGD